MQRTRRARTWRGVLAMGLAVGGLCGHSQAATPEGIWAIPGKVAVRVFDCGGALCGHVVWLRDPALRTPAMCGRTIIWGLKPDGEGAWSGGWFFDPENGRTYDVSATLTAADTINANVYLGEPFLGRTETLRRTSLSQLPGAC